MSDTEKGGDKRGSNLNPEDRAAFERRVAGLDKRLSDVKSRDAVEEKASRGRRTANRGMAYGLRMASELVAAVLVGGAIGYALDHWLGTMPAFSLVLLLLGFVAGVRNVLRGYQEVQADVKASTGGDIGKSLPDDADD